MRQGQVTGVRLVELVRGFTRVIIIGALKSLAETGREPDEVVRCEAKEARDGHRRWSAHSVGLDTALELGQWLGDNVPEEVTVFATKAADVETVNEELSPPVAAAAEQVLGLVRRESGA